MRSEMCEISYAPEQSASYGVLHRPKLAENVPKKSRRYDDCILGEKLIRNGMLDARNAQTDVENEVIEVGQDFGCPEWGCSNR